MCNSTYSDKKFNVVVGELLTHTWPRLQNCSVALQLDGSWRRWCLISISQQPQQFPNHQAKHFLYLPSKLIIFFSSSAHSVHAGFGLNVDNRQPTTCLNALLAQSNPTARPLSREEVLAAFVVKFEDLHDRFLTSGKSKSGWNCRINHCVTKKQLLLLLLLFFFHQHHTAVSLWRPCL